MLIIIVVLAAEVVSALVVRTIILGRMGQHDYVAGSCWTTWLNLPHIFLRYLHLEFIPYPLYSDYQGLPVYTSLTAVGAWMYIIGFIVIFFLLSYILYRQRFLAPWFWFWCALIPFSNILPMDQLAGERFLYIPTIATAWLGALLFKRYTEPYSVKKYRYTIIVTVGIVVIFTVTTLRRAATWENPKTFFLTIVEQLPRSGRARYNLISAYIFDDEIIKAFKEAKILIKLYPNHPLAKKSYGKTLCLMGRFKEGVKILYQEKAHIELNFIGVTAAQNGLFKQAELCFRLAAKLAPDNLRYQKNLARASRLLAEKAPQPPTGASLNKPRAIPPQQNSPPK
ncbi:MAG: hypothetical protein L3J71_10060 [Victivallaceae bacterium]|nr:hypothetical protein [Victivallaceae bacterium]